LSIDPLFSALIHFDEDIVRKKTRHAKENPGNAPRRSEFHFLLSFSQKLSTIIVIFTMEEIGIYE
jgi:hypothetical protein